MRITGTPSRRRLQIAAILSALLSAGAVFAASAGMPAATPLPSPKPHNVARSSAYGGNPRWNQLKPQQKQILEPLSSEWNRMDEPSRQKWLRIAGRFSKASPAEQQRIHTRMQEWAKLTPEQRRIVRENYARAKKLGPIRKSAEWQQYQKLSEEQKKKLAASASPKKHVANLPSHGIAKPVVPPLKSTPKKVLEKSVTPEIAREAPIQASPAPTTPKQH